jgi:hypothetical protein
VPVQIFTAQWVCYVVVVNALTYRRRGRCLLRDRPGAVAVLLAASAVFWWYFEYLNRFVRNWYYIGVRDLSPLEYVLFGTLPFSTVLPAVVSTGEFLGTLPGVTARLAPTVPLRPARPRLLAWSCLLIASAGLAGIAVRPDLLFPLLWISPLVVLTSLQCLFGRVTIFAPLGRGNWERVCRMALAGLVCGFFWELWNWRSTAKWIYTVPYVNRFKVFEMPVLGFVAYLPFGLECAVVADAVLAFTRGARR